MQRVEGLRLPLRTPEGRSIGGGQAGGQEMMSNPLFVQKTAEPVDCLLHPERPQRVPRQNLIAGYYRHRKCRFQIRYQPAGADRGATDETDIRR
jgi:hypothetical protein